MLASTLRIADEIGRYLRDGESDPYHAAWSGDLVSRARKAHEDLRRALVHEVQNRAGGRRTNAPPEIDLKSLTRLKVEPMVRGLFPRVEQETVLALLERSVAFVTTENIEQLLHDLHWPQTAWKLANLYLGSLGVEPLSHEAPRLVGLSEETTCYVSTEYFTHDEPFADFIVHETSHIFHNCKRESVGLPFTRRREWLLDIAYRKRELFAYACEAYASILSRAKSPTERRELVVQFTTDSRMSDHPADWAAVAALVREAAAARNGWKVILARCGPTRPVQRREQ